MRRFLFPRLLPLVMLAACLGLTACSRSDPFQEPITATTQSDYNLWRGGLAGKLTGEDWRWFDVAIQEFKYELMRGSRLSGSQAIDAEVRRYIDNRPLGDVMREGLRTYRNRKTLERDELAAALKLNAKLRLKPDDTDQLRDFKAHQARLQQNLDRLDTDLAAVQKALDRLKPPGAS